MEALLGSLIGVIVVQFSFLWYRIGKLEGRIKALNNNLKGGKDGS